MPVYGRAQAKGLVDAVGQQQQVRRAGRFAALVANGRAPVLGQRMAAAGLDTGQVEPSVMYL